ncbi:MAG: D-glycero-beta-D-manno-heptose 1,7-bisphosphate 7-phosphatase [Burkholderiaceae bacterium]
MKLLILDRDGVINYDSDAHIKSPDEWQPIEGSLEAIARFTKAGIKVVIATNQSGIGRGLFDLDTLGAIHRKMHKAVQDAGGQISAVFFCPHPAASNCACRKPSPGMLTDILERTRINASDAIMVGDSLRDLQAGHAAGCRTILVLTGNGRQTMDSEELPPGTTVRVDLAAVAAEMLT